MNLPKDIYFDATILDQLERPLNTGSVFLSSDSLKRTFYQSSPFPLDSKDTLPTYLLLTDGRKILIRNFQQCGCANCRNYHFDL